MKHLLLTLSIAPLSIALLLAASVRPAHAHPPTPDNRPLIALTGDSITADGTFPAMLQAELPNAVVLNLGVGGATSRDWDPNDRHELDLHFELSSTFFGTHGLFRNIPAATIAIHYVGTNDAIGFFEDAPISPADYELHLTDFATTLRARGVRQVMLVTPPIPDAWLSMEEHGVMLEYGDAVRRACSKVGPDCLIDLQSLYPAGAWDGIHPTPAGSEFIGQVYLEAIRSLTDAKPIKLRKRRERETRSGVDPLGSRRRR